jgi:hypothetical protein
LTKKVVGVFVRFDAPLDGKVSIQYVIEIVLGKMTATQKK